MSSKPKGLGYLGKHYHLITTDIPFYDRPIQAIEDLLLELRIDDYVMVHLTYSENVDKVLINIGTDMLDGGILSVIGIYFKEEDDAIYFKLMFPEDKFTRTYG